MHIFVISLKNSEKRRNRILKNLSEIYINFEFFDAVNGSQLSDKDLKEQQLNLNIKLSKPEIGAMLSHINLWKMIINKNIQQALILEDDVHLGKSFKIVIERIKIPPNSLGIYRLETLFASVNAEKTPNQVIDHIKIRKISTNHAGTAGYLINKATAEYLTAQMPLFIEAIDTELFDPTRSNINMVDIYQCFPAVILQDKCLPIFIQDKDLTSTIGNDRQDIINGMISDATSKFKKQMKNTFRPIYLRLFSLLICHQNKLRLQVKFEGNDLISSRSHL